MPFDTSRDPLPRSGGFRRSTPKTAPGTLAGRDAPGGGHEWNGVSLATETASNESTAPENGVDNADPARHGSPNRRMPASPGTANPEGGPARRFGLDRWRGPAAGTVTTLVVAVPTMVLAEDWGGRPLIDHTGEWWILPGLIAAGSFFLGGMVAARGRRTMTASLLAALWMALPTVIFLLGADCIRRAIQNPTLPRGVVELWVQASVVAVVIALVGGVTMSLLSGRDQPRATGTPGRAS
jgi:hypothetical protein